MSRCRTWTKRVMLFVTCAGAALSPAALFAKPPGEAAADAPKKPCPQAPLMLDEPPPLDEADMLETHAPFTQIVSSFSSPHGVPSSLTEVSQPASL